MSSDCPCHKATPPPQGGRCKLCGRVVMPKHTCHAEGCDRVVPPRLLMCAKYWRMVDRPIQREVWRWYVPGQEVRKDPTAAYLEVMKLAIECVARKEGRR